MSTVSPGFRGRRRRPSAELPPGQYRVEDFPVLSAGPTPSKDLQDWELAITRQGNDVDNCPDEGSDALSPRTISVQARRVRYASPSSKSSAAPLFLGKTDRPWQVHSKSPMQHNPRPICRSTTRVSATATSRCTAS